MSDIQSFFNQVRLLIGNGELKTALNLLRRFLKDSPQLDDALMQSARFEDVISHIHAGTIDFDKATITKNQINKSLLELLREIEEQAQTSDIQEEIKTAASLAEDSYDYKTIKEKIYLNRGANTSELLKAKNTDDLDERELNRLFAKERVIRTFDEEGVDMADLTIQKRLVRLGLAENGHIFKGSFLCLGQRYQIQSICPTAIETKFIIFKGTERDNILIIESLNGNLLQQYDKMMMLLRTHIPLHRVRELSADIYEIPIVAIREFITNAFVHRDYSDAVKSYIQVELFDDRLEIKSPGQLPSNFDNPKIGSTVLNNPTIAAVFNLYKHIERAGTGIRTAQRILQEHGLKKAVIENTTVLANMVQVTIFRENVEKNTIVSSAKNLTFWAKLKLALQVLRA